jgi:hypothetical protein
MNSSRKGQTHPSTSALSACTHIGALYVELDSCAPTLELEIAETQVLQNYTFLTNVMKVKLNASPTQCTHCGHVKEMILTNLFQQSS